MGQVRTLVGYKLRFFFGPSIRGRFGPLPYIGLNLLMMLYGFLSGFGLASVLGSSTPADGIAFLSTPLATFLALALLYAMGSGVTAHASEFDFLMTSPIRPREYLVADLVFQFISLLAAGGAALVLAAVGIVTGVGRSLLILFPFFGIFLAYLFLVLMAIQSLVVLRARFPKAPVRSASFVLFVLSLLPVISLASPAFPIRFEGLPIPPAAFATVGYEVLMGLPVDLSTLLVALVEFGAVALVWAALSDTYIFHEIRPSLSAGFGQVDMMARMNQQRWMIGKLGRVTTRVTIHAERGGDTSFMTRLHLLRILRDGSVIFVVLFALLSVVSVNLGNPEAQAGATIGVTQLMTIIPATLAINWSYYERENLWIALMGGRSAGSYFRGLFLALALLGLLVSVAFLAVYLGVFRAVASVESLALPIGAAVASALVATTLVIKLRIKPAAFSPAMLATFLGVIVGGYLFGFVGQLLVLVGRVAFSLGTDLQAVVLGGYIALLLGLGSWTVARIARSFRL